MEDILKKLSDYAKIRVEESKKRISLSDMRREAEGMPLGDQPFYGALKREGLSFICEVKKASPSKGIIAEDFLYLDIALDYAAAGADAISVLTEPKWFLGDSEYLRDIARHTDVPIIRKDFTIDPYMIYEAKVIGASAVLLICSILSVEELREYLMLSESLGLSALVEAHDEKEIESALNVGAKIIGVNNRNLKDFTVDTDNARRLRSMVPHDVVYVSESGLKNEADCMAAKELGADAVLIGESLMRAPDKKAFLANLRSSVS